MRIKGPDGWYIGPFPTEADAQSFETRLVELVATHQIADAGGPTDPVAAALGRVIAGVVRLIDTTRGPAAVFQAAEAALEDLAGSPGNYSITVNVGKKGEHAVSYQPPTKTFKAGG